MSEKRKEIRQSLDYPCWLDAGPGKPPILCHLRNISKSGAKLICSNVAEIADQFDLYLTRSGSIGRRCHVARREENEIGLLFIGNTVPRPDWPELDPVARVVVA